jgi:hypothetical protein
MVVDQHAATNASVSASVHEPAIMPPRRWRSIVEQCEFGSRTQRRAHNCSPAVFRFAIFAKPKVEGETVLTLPRLCPMYAWSINMGFNEPERESRGTAPRVFSFDRRAILSRSIAILRRPLLHSASRQASGVLF